MAIFTAIGTSVATATGVAWLGALTTAALQIAAGIGISLIAKSLAGEPDKNKFGVQVRLQGGDDVPRSILFGYNCTAGSLVYANVWGNVNGLPNAYLTQVIALADYPIRELLSVEVNGSPVTLINSPHPDRGLPISEFRVDGVDHLWVKFYDGTQTTPDPFLVNTVSNSDRPYSSRRVGRGIPYAIVTSMAHERKDDEENPLFSSGAPTFKFVTNGARLYDISKDSTQGGVGTHRFDDPSTWGGDGDFLSAVQIYNLLRGIRFNSQWLYGLQNLERTRLPPANWISAIQACRNPIQGPNGLEPSYRTGGEIQVGAQIKFSIESILTGCQGRLSEVGGTYKLYIGEPGNPVLSFTDNDILSTEGQTFTPFFSLEDSINGIQAKYPNPEEGWNTKTAPPLIRSDLEILDGNRRLMADVTLDMVPYTAQVQRVMKFALEEAQRARRHTITVGPELWTLEPGDIVQWSSQRNGYIDKLFRVDGVSDKSNLDIILDITEVDPSDYDWDQENDFTPIFDGPLELVGAPPLPMIGWQVYAASIQDETGRDRRPAIEVWYQSGIQDVDRVKIQVRTFGQTEIFFSGEVPYGSPWRTILSADFPPDTEFEVRGIFVRSSGGQSEWSDWLYVKTFDIKFIPGVDFDPYSGVVGFDQLDDDLKSWTEWIGMSPRELIEAIQNVDTHAADQDAANELTFKEIRTEVAVSFNNVEASFNQVITVAIIPLQNQVVALADWLTELSAGDGTDISTARFRMTTLSGPTGYSRIGAETRVDVADPLAWRGAAWYLDTPTDPLLPTRFLVNADQFIAVSGINTGQPLIFQDGSLRVNDLMVTTASMRDLSVTNAKIDNLAVTSAKIDNLAVTSAKIDNLAVTTGKIQDLAVDTLKVAGNAITVPAFASTVGTISISGVISGSSNPNLSPYWTTIQTVSITTVASEVYIDAYCQVQSGSSISDPNDYANIAVRILCDGVELISVRKFTPSIFSVSGALGIDFSIPFIDNPTAGAHTYTLQAAWYSGTGSDTANVQASLRQLRILHRKGK
jgi:hypothetical protein